MRDHWSVEVHRNGESVITIESNCMSGRELLPGDDEIIRHSAQHLLGFIGSGDEPPRVGWRRWAWVDTEGRLSIMNPNATREEVAELGEPDERLIRVQITEVGSGNRAASAEQAQATPQERSVQKETLNLVDQDRQQAIERLIAARPQHASHCATQNNGVEDQCGEVYTYESGSKVNCCGRDGHQGEHFNHSGFTRWSTSICDCGLSSALALLGSPRTEAAEAELATLRAPLEPQESEAERIQRETLETLRRDAEWQARKTAPVDQDRQPLSVEQAKKEIVTDALEMVRLLRYDNGSNIAPLDALKASIDALIATFRAESAPVALAKDAVDQFVVFQLRNTIKDRHVPGVVEALEREWRQKRDALILAVQSDHQDGVGVFNPRFMAMDRAQCDEAAKPETGPMQDTESLSGVQELGSSGLALAIQDITELRDGARNIESSRKERDAEYLTWLWRGKAIAYETVLGRLARLATLRAPFEQKNEDHGAELIHQTIPDVAGTEPRLT